MPQDLIRNYEKALLSKLCYYWTTLDIKQRRSILQLVWADDANCLKNNPVIFNAIAESHIKAPNSLEPSIERLVAGVSATFELSYFGFIVCRGRDFLVLRHHRGNFSSFCTSLVLVGVYVLAAASQSRKDNYEYSARHASGLVKKGLDKNSALTY